MYTDINFFKEIDLNKESDYIIDNNSIKVMYISNDTNTRCKCYNELHKCGVNDCKICHGDGFVKVVKIIDAFIDSANRFNGVGGITDIAGEGHYATHDIYVKNKNYIQEKSYLVVIGFSNGVPNKVFNVYYVSDVSTPRANGGEIKYTLIKGKLSPHKVQLQNYLLNKMPLENKKDLMNGGVYKWMV